jgi:transcriptional regulator with XRE-family HTH domain
MGERIAALRRDRGLSQAALAAVTGVSRSAVAQWETDRAGQVTGNLSRIAQALDVSVEVLLHGEQARDPAALAGDELALLRLYRLCGDDAKAELLRTARRLAHSKGEPEEPGGVQARRSRSRANGDG